MNIKLACCFAGAVMFTVSLPVNAALIGVQDHGTYFTDTQSGLDWLDVTASANRSYNDVSSQFGSGGDFDGWRYATAAEFGAMWDNVTGESAGINAPGQHIWFELGAVIDEVIDLLGDTIHLSAINNYGQSYCEQWPNHCVDGDKRGMFGILSDYYPSPGIQAVGSIEDNDLFSTSGDQVTTSYSITPNFNSWAYGSFLVRDVTVTNVPAPPIIGLLAIGLASLSISRRKLSSRQAQV